MFRRFSLYRRSISLALPFVLLAAWAGCLVLCAEAADDAKPAPTALRAREPALSDSCCVRNCSAAAPAAAFHERQHAAEPGLSGRPAIVPAFRSRPIGPRTPDADGAFYPPPKIVFPRYLRLRNFRI